MDSVYFVGPNSIGNSVTGVQICPIFNTPTGGITSQCTSVQPLIPVTQPFDRTSRTYCSWILCTSLDPIPLGTQSLGHKYVLSLINHPPWGLHLSTPAATLCHQCLQCFIQPQEHTLHGFTALRWSKIPWELMTLGANLSHRSEFSHGLDYISPPHGPPFAPSASSL
jgi:hypothetical protein